jgi:hypothetical protein
MSRLFSSGTLVFTTNKTDCHDITIVENGDKHQQLLMAEI